MKIRMDGKGKYSDNIFMERLCRTAKYEEVYLKAYADGRQAKANLDALPLRQHSKAALGPRLPDTGRSI